ncbi:response regulator transcription factor [Planomonospora parontospora]|uniref:response regulator transcription factor n=1 Tax=Planomonospora parontospora TaxID=58119 RepID=UPI0016701606|nr:response regulator transcription factor [Planomonospora parontospora]GGL59231.1 DNA-binding response regulator [Planomonospora parontospora subsp. antibiotica]GII20301.1 DNA-binding response regulator [Planomonospora parontospora subsp. antibiotica]
MSTKVIVQAAPLVGAAWHALLSSQPGIGDVLVAHGEQQAGALLTAARPNAALIDVTCERPSVIGRLHDACPHIGLLVLVEAYTAQEVVDLLAAGASGCLTRDGTVADLVSALVAVGRGEVVVPPMLATQALAALARGEPVSDTTIDRLSAREIEVLGLLARGLTNKHIAQTLFLSVRTIEAHLRNIFTKLGVTTRTEAALWAVNHGLGEST